MIHLIFIDNQWITITINITIDKYQETECQSYLHSKVEHPLTLKTSIKQGLN